MKIGDLVVYGDGDPNGHIGVVVNIHKKNTFHPFHSAVAVLWSNGVESNHSSSWLIRVEEIK
jgi:hypothetical protein